jgi:hypothetical protein
LLAGNDEIERTIVVEVGEDTGARVVADPRDHARKQSESTATVVDEQALHEIASLAGNIEVEIEVVVHVTEGAGVVDPFELPDQAESAVIVPE